MVQTFSRWLRVLIPDWMHPMLRSVRRVLRRFYFVPVDMLYSLRDKGDLQPPPSLLFVGDGDFKKTGEEFKTHLVQLGGLKADHRVLDIGCGVGRMAVPL